MKKEDHIKINLRFSLINKQHEEIYMILNNLDKSIYKSRNQFIMDAIEFYAKHHGSIEVDEKTDNQRGEFVRRSELSQLENELMNKLVTSVVSETKDEIIRMLASACMGNVVTTPYKHSEDLEVTDIMNDDDTKRELGELMASWDAM